MAWQLIYTSAPRLLEAGRSGFGSVARHRQISPLLVSAIERASQFSRQPGMDSGRVIFSHRIVPISGGRFHVLSCIRDAGADYTGRTNHIAHHLIAEAREVAQLGSQGPSPADVLLAMPWVERWDEHPRYLEAAEEVHLAGFTPQTGADGAHWASVTGSAAHAWLLAAGEASRGAYLIPPRGVDLRWLIADSLRVAPERLWQTTFTTSLQSKDEISDYRWVGLEAGSPLRNETAASGRPILDLTQPESLPEPEIAIAQLGHAPTSIEDLVKIKMPAGGAGDTLNAREESLRRPHSTPHNSAEAAILQRAQNQEKGIRWDEGVCSRSGTLFHIPGWAWIASAAVLVAACVGFFVVKPWVDQLNARKTLASTLGRSEYFGDEPARMRIAKLLLPNWRPDSGAWQHANETADAINRLAAALMRGRYDDIKAEDIKALQAFTGNGGSDEITNLYSLLIAAQERSDWTPSLKSAGEAVGLQQSARDAVNNAIPKSRYESLNKALRESSDVKIAKAEYDLLASASLLPSNNIATFKASIAGLKATMSANNDAMKFLNKAETIVDLWELTEAASSNPRPDKIAALKKNLRENKDKRPEWLSKRTAALLRTDQDTFASKLPVEVKDSQPAATTPLYFVSDVQAFGNAHFQGLRKNLTYFLTSPVEGKSRRLPDPAKDGKLWLNVRDNKAAFVVNEDPPQIIPEPASAGVERPFLLAGKDDADREIIRIYVAAASTKPLFPPTRRQGLTRTGNILRVDFQKLALPGIVENPLEIGLPDECATGGKSTVALPLTKEGKADLEGLVKMITEEREAKSNEIKGLKSALAPKSEDPSANFASRKKIVIQAANLYKESKRKDSQVAKDLGEDSAPLFQQCGNLIVAITRAAPFSGVDKLFEIGKQLSKLSPDADEKARNEKLSTASESVILAEASLSEDIKNAKISNNARSKEEIERFQNEIDRLTKSKEIYGPTLLKLKDLIDSLLPETPQAKAAREAAETQLSEKLKNAQKELERISANPLLSSPSDRLPPGTYRLLTQTEGGNEVLLLELEAAP